jgi:phage/plasmid primase-like uncharacterized protein
VAPLGYRHIAGSYGTGDVEPLTRFKEEEKFREFLNSLDIVPPAILCDRRANNNKVPRCPTRDRPKSKNGAFEFYQDDGIAAGWGQNFRIHDAPIPWCIKSAIDMSREERAKYNHFIESKKKEREEDEELGREGARIRAQEEMERASLNFSSHPYLKKKGVQKHHAKLFNGKLKIPLYDQSGDLVNVQTIHPNGDKRPITGGQYKEIYSVFGDPAEAPAIYIGEGFATCATIHEATGAPVYMSVQCHNLPWMASHVKAKHPGARIVICGDIDEEGQKRAKEATKLCFGEVAFPCFPGGTPEDQNDFNDMAALAGIEAVRALLIGKKEAVSAEDIQKALTAMGYYLEGDPAPSRRIAIIKKMLPRDGTGIIGGQSGAGKSFIAIDLAIAIAAGQSFFGKPTRTRVGTIYYAAEGGGSIAYRIEAAKRARGITERIPIFHHITVGDMMDEKNIEEKISSILMAKSVSEKFFGVPVGLIVFDTISACFHMDDENSNAEAAQICRILKQIADATDCFVIAVHHYGKDRERGLRGASSWRGNVDQVFAVVGDVDENRAWKDRTLILNKNKEGEEGRIGAFELDRVEVGRDEDGEPITSMTVRAMLEKVLKKPSKKNMSQAERTFMKAIEICFRECAFDHQTADGETISVVLNESIRQRFYSIYELDQPDPAKRKDALRRQFSNGRDACITGGSICCETSLDGGVVWLA